MTVDSFASSLINSRVIVLEHNIIKYRIYLHQYYPVHTTTHSHTPIMHGAEWVIDFHRFYCFKVSLYCISFPFIHYTTDRLTIICPLPHTLIPPPLSLFTHGKIIFPKTKKIKPKFPQIDCENMCKRNKNKPTKKRKIIYKDI